MMLERLLYVLAAQITGVWSPSNTCRDLGLSLPTFDRYLSYLKHAFLVFTLPNYAGREATVQKRGRKLYLVDGAIRNAALQRGVAPLSDPVEQGALLQNLGATTLRSLALHSGVRLHRWRDGKHEVDLVFDHPDRPVALEIASSPDHSRSGMRALIERHPKFAGNTYLVAPQVAVSHPSRASEVGTLPLDLLLLVVGAQAEGAFAAGLDAEVEPHAWQMVITHDVQKRRSRRHPRLDVGWSGAVRAATYGLLRSATTASSSIALVKPT